MNDLVARIRKASVGRETAETTITLSLNLDGRGAVVARTGVPFLDHMLDALGRHSRIDLDISCTGDAAMDPHHTVEDIGIAIGQGIRQAL